jgi:hypothetical protein
MQLGYSASFFNHDISHASGKTSWFADWVIQSKIPWTKTMDAGAALDIGMKE